MIDSKIKDYRQLNNFQNLDIVKYIVSIMVICIHCNQLFPQEYLNFFIKNIVCRIAVPFFFITSAYFVRKGSYGDSYYVNRYLKKTIKSYFFWSILFIPIGLDWIHQNLPLDANLLPFALLYGFIHIGTYYHLWYIPAMIFSLFFVHKLLKHFSYKVVFGIAMLLFMFGSLESYYGLLPAGVFRDFFDMLLKIIFTTRSGLFYGMIFIVLGFTIYDYQSKIEVLLKYIPFLTLVSVLLLIVEGTVLYHIVRKDMNFLLSLVPFSFLFFIWMLSCKHYPIQNTKNIRALSKYYYFIHPICIILIEQIGVAYHIDILTSGVFSFMLIVVVTHILSLCIVKMQTSLTNLQIFSSIVSGVLLTFILASIFFFFKRGEDVIKFEFVPCLWFTTSLVILYFITKVHREKDKKLLSL